MSTLVAVEGKAIVKLLPSESITEFGLIIPESSRKPSTHAIVVASKVADVAPGDEIILSGEYAGASFKYEGVEHITVLAEEILGVVIHANS